MTGLEHALRSSYREIILEHVFIGDLLRYFWKRSIYTVEVLKSEVDDSGYDIVLEYNMIVRHVQLKSSFAGSKTRYVNVHTKLQQKPGGCVIWIIFSKDSLDFQEFRWLGNPSGEPLPDISYFPVAKHAKGDSMGRKNERPAIRTVSQKHFTKLQTIADIASKLFDLA